MKRFTKLLLALTLCVLGVGSVNAEDGTKVPLLLLKNGVINSSDFDITPISPSTLTTENLYSAIFTSTGGYCNTFKYENLDVSAYDKAVVKYTIEAGNGDWEINLPSGSFTALPIGSNQTYEIDLSDVDTYGDFTVFSWNHSGKSITISEVYLYKNKVDESDRTLIYECDYTTKSEYTFWNGGFNGTTNTIGIDGGVLKIVNSESKGDWERQYHVGDGIPTKFAGSYVIVAEIKGSDAGTLSCNLGTWSETISRKLSFTDEWSTVEVNSRGLANSSFLLFQSGSFAGTIEIKSIKVYEIGQKLEIGGKVHECDYSTKTEYTFWHGAFNENFNIEIVDGVMTVTNDVAVGNWQSQYFVDDNIPTVKNKDFVMRVKIKGSAAGSLDTQMGDWSNSSGRKLNFTNEWQTIDIWFFNVPATSSHITFQSGGFVGTIEIAKVEVYSVNEVKTDLLTGYKELTLDMCKSWDSPEPGATATGSAGVINLHTALSGGGVVYGGNVPWSVYADVTGYSKLVVTGTPGFPVRILYNRQKNSDGGDGTYGEIVKNIADNGYCEFDLISWGEYAHINSIKKQGWGGDPSGEINELILLGKDASLSYVTLSDVGYVTYAATSNVELLNVTGYAAKYENGSIKLTAVENVPAGDAVILKANAGTYGLPVIDAADVISNNDLQVSDGTVTGDGSTIFALANGASGVGFYKVAASVTIPAGKAYMVITGAGAREFVGFGEDEATGIQTVKTAKADQKIFNLNGQRIAQPVKGLNIIGGKKVMK